MYTNISTILQRIIIHLQIIVEKKGECYSECKRKGKDESNWKGVNEMRLNDQRKKCKR